MLIKHILNRLTEIRRFERAALVAISTARAKTPVTMVNFEGKDIVACGEGGSKTRLLLSREAIVSAAEQTLRESSHTEWSVRGLARTLGCSPGALYRHFPGGFEELHAPETLPLDV